MSPTKSECPYCASTMIKVEEDEQSNWSADCADCKAIWGMKGAETNTPWASSHYFMHSGEEVRALMKSMLTVEDREAKANKQEDGTVLLDGVFLFVGRPTANGNVYSPELAEKMAEQLKNVGFTYFSPTGPQPNPSLSKVVGQVEDAKVDGDALRGTVKLLDTHHGKLLKEMLAMDHGEGPYRGVPTKLAFSVTSYGEVDDGVIIDARPTHVDLVDKDLLK